MAPHNNDLILPSYSTAADKNSEVYDPTLGPQKLDQITASLVTTTSATSTPNPGQNFPSSSVALKKASIYDKNLNRRIPEVNLASLSFLFQEIVSWSHQNSKGIQQLENKLNILGYSIGPKVLELCYLRENQTNGNLKKTLKKDIRIIEILQFIHSVIWKSLFGKTADESEKS